jgi:hypothetical protein
MSTKAIFHAEVAGLEAYQRAYDAAVSVKKPKASMEAGDACHDVGMLAYYLAYDAALSAVVCHE